jgi:hypothetical protein
MEWTVLHVVACCNVVESVKHVVLTSVCWHFQGFLELDSQPISAPPSRDHLLSIINLFSTTPSSAFALLLLLHLPRDVNSPCCLQISSLSLMSLL